MSNQGGDNDPFNSSAALLSQQQLSVYSFPNATLPEGFSAIELPVTVDPIRSIISIDQHRCLVLERGNGTGSVVLLKDDIDIDNGDEDDNSAGGATISTGIFSQRRIVASATGISHGLAIHKNYLYASSNLRVYRWPYDPATVQVTGEAQIVIDNMNALANGVASAGSKHSTRTLIFDSQDRLLVSVGSLNDVDEDSFRSRIRRFVLQSSDDFPIDYVTGEVFADGLRNEVGLGWDRHGILWGVQTGPNDLNRSDLGGATINEDNPAELLHAFRGEVGLHYGYPYCWMEYKLEPQYAMGPGTMWAWPSFMDTVTDDNCRDSNLYIPAELAMQGHASPLGMTFYAYKPEDELATGCSGTFPQWMDGYAFIAFHGSMARQIPIGYKVAYVPMDETGHVAANDVIDLLTHSGIGANWTDGFRPVDLEFDECGRLLVTSDGNKDRIGAKVVRIDYNQGLTTAASSGSFFFAHYGYSLWLSAFIFIVVTRGIVL